MKTNKRNWSLIVGGHYSLSNDTDCDPMTDYSPGIWGIKTQKSALKYAREILADGDDIRVTDYNNANYHALANKFIKELGLKQPLFTEVAPPVSSIVTNGKPSTLGALKKYLTVGTKIRITNIAIPDRSRDTEVVQVKNESIVTSKGTGQSHLYFEKASNWSFDNHGATYSSLYDGKYTPSFKIVYIDLDKRITN